MITEVAKASLTFLAAVLVLVINTQSQIIQEDSSRLHLVALAVLFNSPLQTVGMMLRKTVYTLMSLLVVWLFLEFVILDPSFITKIAVLGVFIFVLSFIRAKFEVLQSAVTVSQLVVVLQLLNKQSPTPEPSVYVMPFVYGTLISCIMSIVFFPRFAHREYLIMLGNVLQSQQDIVQGSGDIGKHNGMLKQVAQLQSQMLFRKPSKSVHAALVRCQQHLSGMRQQDDPVHGFQMVVLCNNDVLVNLADIAKSSESSDLKVRQLGYLSSRVESCLDAFTAQHVGTARKSIGDDKFQAYYSVFCTIEYLKELLLLIEAMMQEVERRPWFQFKRREAVISERTPLLQPEYRQKSYIEYMVAGSSNTLNKQPTTVKKVSSGRSWALKFRLKLWRWLSSIGHSHTLKFALKVSLTVMAMSTMVLYIDTYPLFKKYKGHWAVLSALVIMVPTNGGTNLAGVYRILGTILGAVFSVITWSITKHDPIGLSIMVALASIPCFYTMVATKYVKVGQVTLVAICAILLADYAATTAEDSVVFFALMRGLFVIGGIVVGLVVSWYVWPYEARVELRTGTSQLFIHMGLLYSRLVEVFNADYDEDGQLLTRQTTLFPDGLRAETVHQYYYAQFDQMSRHDTLQYFLAFEMKLHQEILRLNDLLPLTRLEPRLKGPFPIKVYSHLLGHLRNILDKFVAMRVAISNNIDLVSSSRSHTRTNSTGSALREDLILGLAPTSYLNDTAKTFDINDLMPYRKEMVGSMLLCFYLYSGSLILKQPLPTYMPPLRESRERLMSKLKDISSQSEYDTVGHQKYINYYAYSMAMEDVVNELEQVGELLKSLFGEMFADVININQDYSDTETVSTEQASPVALHHNRADQWDNLRNQVSVSASRRSKTLSHSMSFPEVVLQLNNQ